jgi:thiol-disulfide isomerase/thioredoxin
MVEQTAKKRDIEIYLISGFITFIVLVAGISLGILLGRERVSNLEKSLEDLRITQDDTTLGFTLMSVFGNRSCDIIQTELSNTVTEASNLGKEITKYEEEDFKDSNYQAMKKDYTIIQIRYWSYLERLKTECNKTNFITILYFYSSEYCPKCSQQALILNYVKGLYPDNVMVFALDYGIDLNSVKLLKSVYGIDKAPMLVIDDKKYENVVELDELKQILCQNLSICESS